MEEERFGMKEETWADLREEGDGTFSRSCTLRASFKLPPGRRRNDRGPWEECSSLGRDSVEEADSKKSGTRRLPWLASLSRVGLSVRIEGGMSHASEHGSIGVVSSVSLKMTIDLLPMVTLLVTRGGTGAARCFRFSIGTLREVRMFCMGLRSDRPVSSSLKGVCGNDLVG